MKRLAVTILGFILIGAMINSTYADSQMMSPKKQMANGVLAEDVICKGGYTLMIRISGDAACVTPSTANKLNTAGWGEIIKEFEMQAEPVQEEVSLEEEVSAGDEESPDDEKTSHKIELREEMTMAGN